MSEDEKIMGGQGLPDRNDGEAAGCTPEGPSLQELQAELEDYKDRYLRAMAEMDNMRKRQQRQHEETLKYGKEAVLKDFLLVYDAIEKSIITAKELYPDDQPFITGLQMIERLLLDILKRHGVEPIQTQDAVFDPRCHEAMMQMSRPDLAPGMVAEELEKGFMLNDRVLRPAKVAVAA
jgi:molecular chaperone GrpE